MGLMLGKSVWTRQTKTRTSHYEQMNQNNFGESNTYSKRSKSSKIT